MNTKKEILIGLIVGIIANTIGTLLYILIFSDLSISETYKAAVAQEHVGSLLALGAIINLIAFFGFLRIKRTPRGTWCNHRTGRGQQSSGWPCASELC